MPAALKATLEVEQNRVQQSLLDSSGVDDANKYTCKIQGLLDVNRVMARENQYLLAQCEILRKEHDALGHMMRSRMALSNVKELEYKSVIEGMKAVVKEKEDRERSLVGNLRKLEEKYSQLLDIMASYEKSHQQRQRQGMKEKCGNDRNLCGVLKEHQGCGGDDDDVQLAHHRVDAQHLSERKPSEPRPDSNAPVSHNECDKIEESWPTPIMLRLDALQKKSAEGDPLLARHASPSSKDTMVQEEDTFFVSSEGDAFSTNGFTTPEHAVVHFASLHADKAPVQGLFCEQAKMSGKKGRRKSDGTAKRQDHEEACCVEPKSVRSSLRRRKPVNYALPSVRSKLRQGDPHTFGMDSLSSTPASGRPA